MLKMRKIDARHQKQMKGYARYRTGLAAGFGIMVLVGFGISYLSAGQTASAASAASSTSISSLGAPDGTVVYSYNRLSMRDAYPYYVASSFIVAGGLSLYALSYVPVKSERRSPYASRYATFARTTY